MPDGSDFTKVFEELKSIFTPYSKKMDVVQDTDDYYLLNTRIIMRNKRPLAFGMVRKGKSYVSFHLMSVYALPGLLKDMSPDLKKRMQGLACFNFKEVDKKLFGELKKLTKDGAQKFSDPKVIEGLRMVQERGRK
jgi:hypothetical protein